MKKIDLPSEYGYRFTQELRFGGWRYAYVVHGRDGAVEFAVTEYPGRDDMPGSAGLEFHHAAPCANRPPDHHWCTAIGFRSCWHEGTSLYAEESIRPMRHKNDPECMFRILVREYEKRFAEGGKTIMERGIDALRNLQSNLDG